MKSEDQDKLLALLKSPNPLKGLQFIAVKVPLGYKLKTEITSAVEAALTSSEKDISLWARKALDRLKPQVRSGSGAHGDWCDGGHCEEIGPFIEKLKKGEVDLEDLKILVHHPHEEILSDLLDYLKTSKNSFHQSFLARHIGLHYPRESLLPHFAPLLKSEDLRVVSNTLEGIAAINSPKSITTILPFLSHEDNRVRSEAIKALKEHRPKETDQVITAMLRGGKSHHILSAISLISALRLQKFQGVFPKLLNHPLFVEPAYFAFKNLNGEQTQSLLEGVLEKITQPICKARIEEFLGLKKVEVLEEELQMEELETLEDTQSLTEDEGESSEEEVQPNQEIQPTSTDPGEQEKTPEPEKAPESLKEVSPQKPKPLTREEREIARLEKEKLELEDAMTKKVEIEEKPKKELPIEEETDYSAYALGRVNRLELLKYSFIFVSSRFTKWPYETLFSKENIPEKRLEGARKSYAEGYHHSKEELLWLFDNTWFGTGKEGFLITDQHLYYGTSGMKWGTPFAKGKESMQKVNRIQFDAIKKGVKVLINGKMIFEISGISGDEVQLLNLYYYGLTSGNYKTLK